MSSITVSKIKCQSQNGCLSLPDLEAGGGCCDATVCSVHITNSNGSSTCYCDKGCYILDDCCDDILEIGCTGNLPKACLYVYINGYRCWLVWTSLTRDEYSISIKPLWYIRYLELLPGIFVYCAFGACIQFFNMLVSKRSYATYINRQCNDGCRCEKLLVVYIRLGCKSTF